MVSFLHLRVIATTVLDTVACGRLLRLGSIFAARFAPSSARDRRRRLVVFAETMLMWCPSTICSPRDHTCGSRPKSAAALLALIQNPLRNLTLTELGPTTERRVLSLILVLDNWLT